MKIMRTHTNIVQQLMHKQIRKIIHNHTKINQTRTNIIQPTRELVDTHTTTNANTDETNKRT